jgi:hypothetical protein
VILHLRAPLEAGLRDARAQGGDRHARAANLLRQGERERQNVGLGGVVHAHERAGLEGRGRGDVLDPTGPALDHPRQEPAGELGEGDDVDVKHLALLTRFILREAAEHNEAGVIHERVDADPRPCTWARISSAVRPWRGPSE